MEPLVTEIVTTLVVGIPFWALYSRAGLSRAWLLLAVVPLLGMMLLWLVLAVKDWPAQAPESR